LKHKQTVRFDCEDCRVEFDVTYEPRATVNDNRPEVAKAVHCPFCGDGPLTSDDDREAP